MGRLELVPISPALGVEVRGLDLAAVTPEHPISDDDATDLRDAFAEHHLLLVRGDAIPVAGQLGLLGLFGPVLVNHGVDHAYVSNARADGIIGLGELRFHSDLAFTPEPDLGLSLYGVDIPPEGTTTRFANAAKALLDLEADVRAGVAGLSGRHAFDLATQHGDGVAVETSVPESAYRADHPVVLRDPTTGTDVLYVSEMQTECLVGLAADESRRLLRELFATLYRPENVYVHEWREHDLVVWNNMTIQHARGPVGAGSARTLRRATIAHRPIEEILTGFTPRIRAV
jgi:taurine dioxygenase